MYNWLSLAAPHTRNLLLMVCCLVNFFPFHIITILDQGNEKAGVFLYVAF